MLPEPVTAPTRDDGEANTVHVEPRWERVECTCPDWCERDHELD